MPHRVLDELSFGGGALMIRSCMSLTLIYHLVVLVPSGIGQYHGKYSFDTFSHMKSYTFKSTRLESSVYFPPYKGKFKYIKAFLKIKII